MKNVNIRTILILSFQLIIIIVLVASSTAYVRKLAAHTETNMQDNVRSVRYCAIMQQSLSSLQANPDQITPRTDFENNLKAELNNITEPGEKELADNLKDEYFLWLKIPVDSTYQRLVKDINGINELNISAIEKNSTTIQKAASKGNSIILLIGFFGALAAFIFTFAFIGQLLRKPPGMG